jgi:hypothetical protein
MEVIIHHEDKACREFLASRVFPFSWRVARLLELMRQGSRGTLGVELLDWGGEREWAWGFTLRY